MNEIRIPWRFRTHRSTSSSKTTTGNTFLGFRKLVNNTFTTLPEGSRLVCVLQSAVAKQHPAPYHRTGFWTVSRQTTRRPYQTQNFDKLFGAFLLSWKHFPSPLLFCVVPLLWGCSKRLLVQISLILQFWAKNTTDFPKQHIWVRC